MNYQLGQLAEMFAHLGKAARQLTNRKIADRESAVYAIATTLEEPDAYRHEVTPLMLIEPV